MRDLTPTEIPIDKNPGASICSIVGLQRVAGASSCVRRVHDRGWLYSLRRAAHDRGHGNDRGAGTMPMMWMAMPGQSWLSAAVMFLFVWQGNDDCDDVASRPGPCSNYTHAWRATRGTAGPCWTPPSLRAGYFAVWPRLVCVAFAWGLRFSSAAMTSVGFSRLIPGAAGIVLILSWGVAALTNERRCA